MRLALVTLIFLLFTQANAAISVTSKPVVISVKALGVVPYALPLAGKAVAIGVNTANDVRPSGFSTILWGYGLFNCYGTGAFVPDYSSIGAFVIAGSGGHNCPAGNIDAVLFDFSDARWKRVPNSNGVISREGDYSRSETTGDPYYEISPGMPAPAHLYTSTSYIPTSLGGGSKGSYLMMGASAQAIIPVTGKGIHKFNLATGLWSRVGDEQVQYFSGYSTVASVVFDPVAKRYYFIEEGFHVNNFVLYLDAIDWKMKRTETFPYPSGFGGERYQVVFYDPVRRLLLNFRSGYPLRALHLENIKAGWVVLTTSGTLPSLGENRWAFYEPNGSFYTRTNDSGQVIYRLTPPSGDWKSGTWTYSSVSIGGAIMPNHTTSGGSTTHYGTFFYVPAIQSLAWIAGEASNVVILRPP